MSRGIEMKPGYGYTDNPIKIHTDDILGIKHYVDSLSEFILKCDTPMTISIQGEWGSGKTSMMNLIRANIADYVVPAWFNTWQYSQFEMTPYLTTSLLANFFNVIDDADLKKKIKKIGHFISAGLKKVAVYGAEHIAGVEGADDLKKLMGNPDPTAFFEELKEFKDEIERSIEKRLKKEKGGKDRIVIFIDDLDRLQPRRAVEFLEVVKVFLDIPKCVYVIAVDYEVVVRGLQSKFGNTFDESKSRSFFEKIIQLPFGVPIGNYNIEKYVESLLNTMKINIGSISQSEDGIEADLLGDYKDLIDKSVGFNPRSMKRLFNNFLLLNKVAEKRGVLGTDNDPDRNNKLLMLFGIICMQLAFKEAYDFMLDHRNDINAELFKYFSSGERMLSSEDEFGKQFSGEINEIGKKLDIKRIANFMSELADNVKFEDDEPLTDIPIQHFKDILSFSSITSISEKPTQSSDQRLSRSDLSNYLVKVLQQKKDGAADTDEVLSEIKKILREQNIDPGPDDRFNIDVYSAAARARKKGLLYKVSARCPKGRWGLTASGIRK
jgi:hypothetical protein